MTGGTKALICFGKCCVTINCSKSLGRRLKEEASQGKRNVSYQLDSFKKAHFFFVLFHIVTSTLCLCHRSYFLYLTIHPFPLNKEIQECSLACMSPVATKY